MNKYLFLLLLFLAGFTSTDVQKEIYTIDWQTSADPENILGYTFPEAEFIDSESHLPYYCKIFRYEKGETGFQFTLENSDFEPFENDKLNEFSEQFPDEAVLKTNRFKSGDIELIELRIPAVIRKNDKFFRLKKFGLKKTPVMLKSAAAISGYDWKTESALKDGKWVKISMKEKGVYKIPYSKLTSWGFPNPSQVKVFGAGGTILPESAGDIKYDDVPQVSVWHGKSNGADCIFFFAPGTTEWNFNKNNGRFEHRINPYATRGFFFLTDKSGSALQVEASQTPAEPSTHSVAYFDEFILHKTERFNLIQSGKQWFSERFSNGSTRNFTFALAEPEASTSVSVKINAAGRSSATSEMTVSTGSANTAKINFSRVNTSSNAGNYADEGALLYTLPAAGNVDLALKYSGSGSLAEAWLDFIELNYRRKLKLTDQTLFFRDVASVGSGNIAEFSIENTSSDVKVWDVTDQFRVKEVQLNFSGNKATAKQPAQELREYVAFSPNGNLPEPEFVEDVENQNLHGISTPEFLIVTHANFLEQANNLADFHRTYDNMQVEVVSADKIYNEFSSGNKDATGIRNFIKMLYDRKQGLKYVLLFGDGSYDNKGILSGSNNFIPTFQSDNSLSGVDSFVSDDYFVILDDGENVYSGAIDLGIGRIPVSTVFQAELSVGKVRDYHGQQALGNWRNVVCFIADDKDGNLHMADSERLANQVNDSHGEFVTNKIYFDAYQQISGPGGQRYPEVTDAINEQVKDGVLILNYVGHANDRFLADERVLEINHINAWTNAQKLLIFMTATCEFSRFDADDMSAGEYVLFNPNGGGIGLFSTTRLVLSAYNYQLSRNFYNSVFEKDEQGQHYRMGDIMRLAKINTSGVINKRNFSLLANPALRLAYPRHRVYTTKINGQDAEADPDTIGALQKITISGFVGDESGSKLSGFNGTVTPTVFDKSAMMTTKGNGGETPMNYKVQNSVIYKGTTRVTDGEFSFSFVIPKDISYSLGEGKIMYYAENGETDAHGAFTNFYIGGAGSQIEDSKGPEIELFLDSPDFKSGDRVSNNPVLLAYLSDENGINTAGSGIGHDITATLDDDYANVMVLNNYFQADIGDYTKVMIRYPLRNLLPGRHKLRLKAWDVANNSSEAEIEFEVTGEFTISAVTNYPNPVRDHTYFTFEHNRADASFDVLFEILDVEGRRIDNFKTQISSAGTVSNPVRWDLTEAGIRLRDGIYLYRVVAQSPDGLITSKTGKMSIVR